MGAKGSSSRLPQKNWREFRGKPMFLWNIEKGLKVFDEMYITSDLDFILDESKKLGAKPIKRTDPYLMECPNIEYYQYCMRFMDSPDAIVAIQANSPTVDINTIALVKRLLEMGVREIMTCHPSYAIYGSVWGITKERLEHYDDPREPLPDVLVVDPSTDIHTIEDLEYAEKCL